MADEPSAKAVVRGTEHPWERERRLAFARWETELHRIPYGRRLPDVIGFAHSIEPPAHWAPPDAKRRLFAVSALPTGAGATYLASIPSRARLPAEGALVKLPQPTKGVLSVADTGLGEVVLEAAEGPRAAGWEEILPGVSTRSVTNVVPELADLWHLPARAVESLLLPLVGSIPWHGRPAGIDLCVEWEGWSLVRQRSFLSGVLELLPEWVRDSTRRSSRSRPLELASGARVRRGRIRPSRPFSLQLRPISGGPAPTLGPESVPRSVITYGRPLTTEFASVLFSGQSALLLGSEEIARVPRGPIEIPDSLRARIWGLHWWTPEPPDAPDWHRWLGAEEPRVLEALRSVPEAPEELWKSQSERRAVWDRLIQTAIAHARLRAAAEVEERDFGWVVDSLVDVTQRATEWRRAGRGPWSRTLDRTEGGRTTRLRRSLEALLRDRPEGLSLDEAVAASQASGARPSAWDVENQLERLRIRGSLYQDRTGRYRTA